MADKRQKTEVFGSDAAVDELIGRAMNPPRIDDLDPQKARAISALLTSRNKKEAAQKAKISERTLRSWMSDPTFAACLHAATAEMIGDSQRRAARLLEKGLDKLEEQLSDPFLDCEDSISLTKLLVDAVSKLGN